MLRDRPLSAVRTVWEALRPLGVGLHEAEQVVHARYEALGDQVQRTPPDPLDLASLAARVAALPGHGCGTAGRSLLRGRPSQGLASQCVRSAGHGAQQDADVPDDGGRLALTPAAWKAFVSQA